MTGILPSYLNFQASPPSVKWGSFLHGVVVSLKLREYKLTAAELKMGK